MPFNNPATGFQRIDEAIQSGGSASVKESGVVVERTTHITAYEQEGLAFAQLVGFHKIRGYAVRKDESIGKIHSDRHGFTFQATSIRCNEE